MTDDFEDFIERPSMPNFFAASSGAALKLAKPQQQQQQSATTSTKSQVCSTITFTCTILRTLYTLKDLFIVEFKDLYKF